MRARGLLTLLLGWVGLTLGGVDRVVLLSTATVPSRRALAIRAGVEEELQRLTPTPELAVMRFQLEPNPAVNGGAVLQQLNRLLTGADRKLVVTTDNQALDFVLEHQEQLPAELQVVFCGYVSSGNFPQTLFHNVTGVLEENELSAVLRLGLRLFPATRRVLVISSASPRGRATDRRVAELRRELRFPELISLNAGTCDTGTMLEQVRNAPPDSLILYNSWSEPATASPVLVQSAGTGLEQVAGGPILSFDDAALGWGVVGSCGAELRESGRAAGRLVGQLLTGVRGAELPVQTPSPKIRLDWTALQRWGVPPERIPEGVELLNAPSRPWRSGLRYWPWALGAVVAAAVLWGSRRRVRRRAALRTRELTERLARYEELPVAFIRFRPDGVLCFVHGLADGNFLHTCFLPGLELAADRVARTLRTGEAGLLELESGELCWRGELFRVRAPDGAGDPGELLWLLQEVTPRGDGSAGLRQLRRFRTLLESLGCAVILIGRQGKIDWCNRAALALSRVGTGAAVTGRHWDEIFQLEHRLTGEVFTLPDPALVPEGVNAYPGEFLARTAEGGARPVRLKLAGRRLRSAPRAEGLVITLLDWAEPAEQRRRLQLELARRALES